MNFSAGTVDEEIETTELWTQSIGSLFFAMSKIQQSGFIDDVTVIINMLSLKMLLSLFIRRRSDIFS